MLPCQILPGRPYLRTNYKNVCTTRFGDEHIYYKTWYNDEEDTLLKHIFGNIFTALNLSNHNGVIYDGIVGTHEVTVSGVIVGHISAWSPSISSGSSIVATPASPLSYITISGAAPSAPAGNTSGFYYSPHLMDTELKYGGGGGL